MFADPTTLDGFLRAAPRLFVLTGAGCSTASGIPDYRDDKGEWKYKPPVQYQDYVTSFETRRVIGPPRNQSVRGMISCFRPGFFRQTLLIFDDQSFCRADS